VWAYPTNTGCDGTRIFLGNTMNDNSGTLQYDGLPYGNYTLCAYQSSGPRRGTATVNVNSTSGISTFDLSIASSTKVCGYESPDGPPN
jgi:hypothetical protein